jgi:hypothetical protein
MYTISKDLNGIVLLCHNCSHVERLDSFREGFGDRQIQAARAMQKHSREKHGSGAAARGGPNNDALGAHGS